METITADPAPSTASCAQINTAETAAVVSPTSRSDAACAATTQKAKPEPVWAPLAMMRPSELRRAECRTGETSMAGSPLKVLTTRNP
jgi:hypothetical protein